MDTIGPPGGAAGCWSPIRCPSSGAGSALGWGEGLSFLGFGSLGNGIFVSPHDLRQEVRQLIGRQEVEQDVTVHYGSLEWPADPAQVVARAWDLAGLEEPYRGFLLRIREGLAEAEALDDRESFCRRFLLTHEFRRFPFSDPDLPDRLRPPGWFGTAAGEAFLEYNGRLREPAGRFYKSIAEDPTIVDNIDR